MTSADEPEFKPVGPDSLLPPPGRLSSVFLDKTEIVIANVDGRYHALDGLCDHAGYPLASGQLVGCELTCPLHGWIYDVTDGWVINPPFGHRTRSYKVRVTDGVVEVALAE